MGLSMAYLGTASAVAVFYLLLTLASNMLAPSILAKNRSTGVFSSSAVMATSRRSSSARTCGAVAVQALRPVAEKIRALFAAVALRMSAAATLASVAASGEGPQSRDRKNLGHRLSRSSLMEE